MPRSQHTHQKRNQLTSPANSLTTSSSTPQRPSFFKTMKEGVAFGAGASLGQSIFRSIFTGPAPQPNTAGTDSRPTPEYLQCMIDNNNDKEACKEYK